MAVVFKATSDFDAVLKDYDKLQRQVVLLNQKLKDTTDESGKNKGATDSLANNQLGFLKSAIAGWVSLEGVVRTVGSALDFAAQETEAAVQSMDRLTDSRRRLAQVALSGADLEAVEKQADELAVKHGVSREAAREVMFDARSLGVDDAAVQDVFRFQSVVDTQALTQAAGKLPGIFQNQITGQQAQQMSFVAARQSALSFEDLMQSIPTSAMGVQAAGGQASEAAAIVSVLSSQMADKSQAGNLVKALGVKVGIDNETFPQKQGVLGAVQQLQQMKPEARQEFLGESQELNVAFQKISANMDEIIKRRGELEQAIQATGTAAAPLEQARAAVFDPSTDIGQRNLAQQEMRRAEIARDVERESRFGESGALAQAGKAAALARLDRQESGLAGKYAAFSFGEVVKQMGGSRPMAEEGSLVAASAAERLVRSGGDTGRLFTGLFTQRTAGERALFGGRGDDGEADGSLTRGQQDGNKILADIRDGINKLADKKGPASTSAAALAIHSESR